MENKKECKCPCHSPQKEDVIKEFEKLLKGFGDGYYWESEGWTEEHKKGRTIAEKNIKDFLCQKIQEARNEGYEAGLNLRTEYNDPEL